MLTGFLPGVRELRTPLVVGWAWILTIVAWCVVLDRPSGFDRNSLEKAIVDRWDHAPTTERLLVLNVVAYAVGATITSLPDSALALAIGRHPRARRLFRIRKFKSIEAVSRFIGFAIVERLSKDDYLTLPGVEGRIVPFDRLGELLPRVLQLLHDDDSESSEGRRIDDRVVDGLWRATASPALIAKSEPLYTELSRMRSEIELRLHLITPALALAAACVVGGTQPSTATPILLAGLVLLLSAYIAVREMLLRFDELIVSATELAGRKIIAALELDTLYLNISLAISSEKKRGPVESPAHAGK